ncbi:hypothetical protein AMECASPLE_012528 [Ameca splendens]|uniref:Uncharacterized protein n=1 Tax=Ameca splendens TaxID=208324 RepID=A0ABV0ZAA9_9TELE
MLLHVIVLLMQDEEIKKNVRSKNIIRHKCHDKNLALIATLLYLSSGLISCSFSTSPSYIAPYITPQAVVKEASNKPLLHHAFSCGSPSDHNRGCQKYHPSSTGSLYP